MLGAGKVIVSIPSPLHPASGILEQNRRRNLTKDERTMISLKGRDYIETQDLSDAEIELLLNTATELKQKFHRGEPTQLLPHQTAFLLFFDKSTRTRNAFEAGMTQLGGHAHFLDSDATQISHGETPEDTGKILSSMGHGICIRHDLVLNE